MPSASRSSILWRVSLLVFIPLSLTASVRKENPQKVSQTTIQMQGYSPTQNDDYVATVIEAPTGYIVGFEPLAHADRVHHILLYGCTQPAEEKSFWKGGATCGYGASHILYAWARNAPSLSFPKDVAFSVGHETDGIRYIVLQVHYAQPFDGNVKDYSGVTLHVVGDPPKYLAAVLLFVSGESIPPGLSQYQNNISCYHQSDTEIHPFAFRTHTHAMGRVVSAFFKHDNKWNMIGRRNPQWPQLFEKIDHDLVIHNGDPMIASCRFDSSDKKEPTPMGSMGTNEMCNFYMMFYWDAQKENPFPQGAMCAGNMNPEEAAQMPVEGTMLLPSRPELEHHAHQAGKPFGVVEEAELGRLGAAQLGQISGMSFTKEGHVVVFHRATRVWDQSSFDFQNVLQDQTPIPDATVVVVDFTSNVPTPVALLGRQMFYMPHGILVDSENNYYTTDVGSHQVIKHKVGANGELEPIWAVGEKFVPGSDRSHLCKPTGIAAEGGMVYISDGYCNARILVLNAADGRYASEFGSSGQSHGLFFLPHDIVISQQKLFVSDRENGRVQVFQPNGAFVEEFKNQDFFNNIYSADVIEDHVFMIPGETRQRMDGKQMSIAVFAGRVGRGLIEYSFKGREKGFSRPHILRACPDEEHIYVGEIDESGGKLWKFKIEREMEKKTDHGQASSGSWVSSGALPKASSSPSIVIFVCLGAIALCGFVLYVRRRDHKRTPQGLLDRTGFKPLRTDDFAGDLSESETD